MRVHLQYGRDGLDVELPARNVTLLEPRYVPGLPDEAAAFREAVERREDLVPLGLAHAARFSWERTGAVMLAALEEHV